MSNDEIYEKYTKILDIILRTCATMLAIVFAYSLGGGEIVQHTRPYLILLTILLIFTIVFAGVSLVVTRKDEPKTLKGIAIFCFGMMVALAICMLLLLIFALYG